MHKKRGTYLGTLLALMLLWSSCEEQNFFGGPVYDFEGNLRRDRAILADFIETFEVDSVRRIHDPSGVIIIVQEEGTGSQARPGNVIYTEFDLRLLDGSIVDTTREDVAIANDIWNENVTYTFFQFVIPTAGQGVAVQGLNIGFQRLRSGSKAIIIVPSALGFQDRDDIPNIPPDSNLIYEVEFLGFD